MRTQPDRRSTDPPVAGPLAGLRVLELGTLIAGPFAGRVFADFGAEVVKVEHPLHGDPLRSWGSRSNGGDSLWHLVQSRGKRSVAADLHDPADQDLVRALAARERRPDRELPARPARGVEPRPRRADAPRTRDSIVVRISGYGQTGPLREQPGFGTIAEAAGGLRYLTGEPDRPPARVGLSLGDSVASLHAVIGALVALRERDASGRGQVVDVALTEAVFSLLGGRSPGVRVLGRWCASGWATSPTTRRPRTPTRARTDRWSASPPTRPHCSGTVPGDRPRRHRRRARPVGQQRPGSTGRRARRRRSPRGRARRTAEDVVAILRERRVPVSRINSIADIVADPQFQARGMVVAVDDERLDGPLLVPGVVPRLSRTPGRVPPLGRPLGEDTDRVRHRLQPDRGRGAPRRRAAAFPAGRDARDHMPGGGGSAG